MNQEKIQDIMEQTDKLTIEELRDLLRQLKIKERAWREQGKESVLQTEKEKEKLVQSGILRKISLIVQGHQFFLEDGKPSSYEYILVDDETGQIRKKVSPRMDGETSNRAIILGIMDAVQRLSADRRCQVKVYTRGSWGYTKMKKQSKGTNGDLLEQLQAVIEEKQVMLEAFLNTEMVETYF